VNTESNVALPEWTGKNENLRLPVSREEMAQRRDAVLEAMQREGVDVAVFTTPETIFYLTGIGLNRYCYQPLIISASGKHRYTCRHIDLGWQDVWGPQTWVKDWVSFRDHEDVLALVSDLIREIQPDPKKKPTLGFELERSSISYNGVNRIAQLAEAGNIVSCTRFAEDLRVIKSPAEIELMRRSGRMSSQLADVVVQAVRAGATDAEASIAAGQLLNQLSGSPRPAPTVHTGAAAGNGHMTAWTNMAPRPGETVTFHVSGFVSNYACPIERTILRGPDKNNILPMLDAVERVTQKLVASLRPGMTSSAANEIALAEHRARGYDQHWRNHAGYSTGINWVEFDLFRIRPDDERTLKPGMTLHLVQCLTVPGLTNAQASRVVVITDDGAELLNDYPLRIEPFN